TDYCSFLVPPSGRNAVPLATGRLDEAERVFDRMLWLNPTDNQGVRFLPTDVKAGKAREDHPDEW
ncbi:MAG: hypothetical protein L6433_02530, partial [Actinomycetia bacterium]|nr:hypothetical protein [Actinomycetes bacterium]